MLIDDGTDRCNGAQPAHQMDIIFLMKLFVHLSGISILFFVTMIRIATTCVGVYDDQMSSVAQYTHLCFQPGMADESHRAPTPDCESRMACKSCYVQEGYRE